MPDEIEPQSIHADREVIEDTPEPATEQVGEAAVEGSTTKIPVTADEAMKYEVEHEANQAGWAATAQELNKEYRSKGQKLLGKNKFTPGDVMYDEALRANEYIDYQLGENLKEIDHAKDYERRRGEPLREELPPTNREGTFQQLKSLEKDKIDEGWTLDGEPIFNPKTGYTEKSAREINQREKKTARVSEKVSEALGRGDIAAAEQALADSYGDGHAWTRKYDPITMQQHIMHDLQRTVASVFINKDMDALGQLLEAKLLSRYITPNMARDAGVSETLIKNKSLTDQLDWLAMKTIERYGPHLNESDRYGGEPARKELDRRLEVLGSVGVLTPEELTKGSLARSAARHLTIETTAADVSRGYDFNLSREGWMMYRRGLVDLERLSQDPDMVRVALMAVPTKTALSNAKKQLRKTLLGEETPDQAAA